MSEEVKITKKQVNQAASLMAKRRHQVSPRSKEDYLKMARKGAEARWGKKK